MLVSDTVPLSVKARYILSKCCLDYRRCFVEITCQTFTCISSIQSIPNSHSPITQTLLSRRVLSKIAKARKPPSLQCLDTSKTLTYISAVTSTRHSSQDSLQHRPWIHSSCQADRINGSLDTARISKVICTTQQPDTSPRAPDL